MPTSTLHAAVSQSKVPGLPSEAYQPASESVFGECKQVVLGAWHECIYGVAKISHHRRSYGAHVCWESKLDGTFNLARMARRA